MAEIVEFTLPEFLEGQDADRIHAGMLKQVPDEFDKSEGGFVWDMTYPTAIEKAQIAQYLIPEALRAMFPMWAQGQMLDMHAANRGMERKAAQTAHVQVVFTGTEGAKAPRGTVVSTLPASDEQSIAFTTLEDCTISDGEASVEAEALTAGLTGNVAAGSICRLDAPVSGITSVNNPQAAQGGVDEESDELLRQRIVEFDAVQGRNFVGSIADYRRWALEVGGVGGAKVLQATDDSGIVTIIITDATGGSASDELCQAVSDHIMRPDSPQNRLAPIKRQRKRNDASAAYHRGIGTGNVGWRRIGCCASGRLWTRWGEYFADIDDGVVRLTRVGALLSAVEGVVDYASLKLNGAAQNIALTDMQLPMTGLDDVTLT